MTSEKDKTGSSSTMINKLISHEPNLMLNNKANILDAIIAVNKAIWDIENFFVYDCGSFLHAIYNPTKKRFYQQVTATDYEQNGKIFSVRENLKNELPERVTITLIPTEEWTGTWEEPTDYKEFLKAIQTNYGGKT
ncbi:MAG: hypothetical protein QW468_00255 [Candidatus Bathyarchaeia archaeon]